MADDSDTTVTIEKGQLASLARAAEQEQDNRDTADRLRVVIAAKAEGLDAEQISAGLDTADALDAA